MTGVATAIAAAAVVGGIASNRAAKQTAKAAEDSAAIQAESGEAAIIAQREAAERAQTFFDPFAGVAERGVGLSGFLADPQQQFDFLQNNPLFNLALENANRSTLQGAAAGGRLAAGDTLTDLSSNVLLQAQPLIDRQRQDIAGLLNLGVGVAGSQANIETGLGAGTSGLLTDIGSVQGAGIVGAGRANAAGTANVGSALTNSLLAGATILNQRGT